MTKIDEKEIESYIDAHVAVLSQELLALRTLGLSAGSQEELDAFFTKFGKRFDEVAITEAKQVLSGIGKKAAETAKTSKPEKK